jgi:hypothetical protein
MNREALHDKLDQLLDLLAAPSDVLVFLLLATVMVCLLAWFMVMFPPPEKGLVSRENRRPKFLISRWSRKLRRHCHGH